MKRTLYAICILLNFLISSPLLLNAEVNIRITQGVNSARPIGIIPFQYIGLNVLPENISDIVSNDLRNSGKFIPLNENNLPQQINTVSELKPAAWSVLGIDAVVIGKITSNKDEVYEVSYQLVDTSSTTRTVLAQNSYKVNRKFLRYAGHATSDEIFEKLTGIKGVFCTHIAYIVKTNNNQFPYELQISDYDGYNRSVIHRSSQPLMSPAWSPDGSKIAYVTFESGRSALVIQTLSSGEINNIVSFPCHNGAPAFSPDGTKLAFALSETGSLNLCVMDLLSGNIHRITNNHSNNTEPSWFPDSQSLAFTSDQTGHPQIYKVRIDDGYVQRITWKGLQNQNSDVSKDGKFIIMVSLVNNQQHIVKQDLLTGNVQALSSTFLDETPSISPNDAMIIYGSSQDGDNILNLISTDGRFKVSLPKIAGQIRFPAWSPFI